MCRAWWLIHQSGEVEDERLLLLFRVLRWRVEAAKSRWLGRDLTQPGPGPEGLDERLDQWGRRMREELAARPGAGRRIDSDQASRLATLSRDEKITELRERLPEGSALMSFHESRECTFVSCVTPDKSVYLTCRSPAGSWRRQSPTCRPVSPERAPAPRSIRPTPSSCGALLQADARPGWPVHSAGRDRAGQPDPPDRPRTAPGITSRVHALLLPQLQGTGRNPALSYVPSLDTATVLFERAEGRPAAPPSRPTRSPKPIGRCSRPATDTSRTPCVTSFPGSTRCSVGTSPPNEVLSMASRSELLHVLAHGSSPRAPGAIMNAGLALLPGTGESGLLSATNRWQRRSPDGICSGTVVNPIWRPSVRWHRSGWRGPCPIPGMRSRRIELNSSSR
jgi:hypothetical protein